MGWREGVVIAIVLGACGGGDATPDAVGADRPDAPVGCDYVETNDSVNGVLSVPSGLPETTGRRFAAGSTITICGAIDVTHFAEPGNPKTLIDTDSYTIVVPAAADIRVSLIGPDLAALTDPDKPAVVVDVATPCPIGAGDCEGYGQGAFTGMHAVVSARVPGRTIQVTVTAHNKTVPAAPVPYRVVIAADDVATRCAAGAGSVVYGEALDGPQFDQNDVIDYDSSMEPWYFLTASATDAPEPTGFVATGSSVQRVEGTISDAQQVGSYADRDTYEVATDATTNELTIRFDHPGSPTPIDVFVFGRDELRVPVFRPVGGTARTDLATFAVKPGTPYWVWIGGCGSRDLNNRPLCPVLPTSYRATICGRVYTP